MKNNRKSKARTTSYNFSSLTAYAVAFYYQEVFGQLASLTSSALYAKKVVALHYRDTEKQVVYSMPHMVYQKTISINDQVELCFEQVSYPYNAQGVQKIKNSGWSAVMITVMHDQREIQISCRPGFEMRSIIMQAQVEQWLARNRSVPSKKISQKLKERFLPTRVLPLYQKDWEEIIQGSILASMMP